MIKILIAIKKNVKDEKIDIKNIKSNILVTMTEWQEKSAEISVYREFIF